MLISKKLFVCLFAIISILIATYFDAPNSTVYAISSITTAYMIGQGTVDAMKNKKVRQI